MKKLLLTSVLAMIASLSFALTTTTLVDGRLYTNATQIVGSNTNQIGVVTGAATNTFNLSAGIGLQANTNLWPSAGVSLIGYPGTLYGPVSAVWIQATGNLVATNATSTTITFRFAGSADGSLWVSNYLSKTAVVAVNVTGFTEGVGVVSTNITTGGLPYLALQAIENPGAAALTNIVVQVTGKPGL